MPDAVSESRRKVTLESEAKRNMRSQANCVISIPLHHDPERHWPPVREERLYASELADGSYRLESIPYFALSMSKDDIVHASTSGSIPLVDRVLEHRGHSTFRVMCGEGGPDVLLEAKALFQSLGCRVERHPNLPLIALSVPPSTDITAVYDWLQEGADEGRWDYEVGFDFHSILDGGCKVRPPENLPGIALMMRLFGRGDRQALF